MNENRPTNVTCPNCDGPMIPRNGQYGKFWGCKDYPKCKGTRDSEGLSKEDRHRIARDRDTDKYEDIGPDPFKESNGVMTSFKKKV